VALATNNSSQLIAEFIDGSVAIERSRAKAMHH
jgi:hypothetical protein